MHGQGSQVAPQRGGGKALFNKNMPRHNCFKLTSRRPTKQVPRDMVGKMSKDVIYGWESVKSIVGVYMFFDVFFFLQNINKWFGEWAGMG